MSKSFQIDQNKNVPSYKKDGIKHEISNGLSNLLYHLHDMYRYFLLAL